MRQVGAEGCGPNPSEVSAQDAGDLAQGAGAADALGDSDQLVVGQDLFVIGNPRGLANTFTSGILSGVREFAQLYDGTILVEFLQTDAAINSGNSGGPILDSSGRVVGIASRILTQSGGSEGLGFAVAINSVKQLLALEDRSWTGFTAIYLGRAELGHFP